MLYGDAARRWAMTERPAARIRREAHAYTIGPSRIAWDGQRACVTIDERGAPLPRPIRGRVVLETEGVGARDFALDAAGRHRWWPIAAAARITVALDEPRISWHGHGYFDQNWGSRPLEADFVDWDWSRATTPSGSGIHYDARRTDGTRQCLSILCRPDGRIETIETPPAAPLPKTFWRLGRGTRAHDATGARVIRTLTDTPFYARSVIETEIAGSGATAMHESLSLTRFAARPVQLMLPFRVPRIWW